jgi:predicted ArsR family transcriptional regulator
MGDRENVRRAEQARQILDNPLWVEAWDAYRQRLIEIWEESKPDEVTLREEAKHLLRVALAARRHLERLVVDGKVSAESIKIEEARKKWYQRTGT